ncbi:MAG: glycosyl transferase [Methylotenera sp.]|nr:glycosyl transferase [Oligoflexia bacterium]
MRPHQKPESGRSYADFLKILRRSTDLLNTDPVREELFSVERLEQYSSYLATQLTVSADPARGRSLLPELSESGKRLLAAYRLLADTVRTKQAISPAAEWFLDNFHIIEDQIRGIQRDLPKDYYYELPKLAEGELAGYPRVYAMALAFIAHTDSRLDAESLKRFLQSYQTVTPLKMGELWAVALTLRIALVQQLEPLALSIVNARQKREQADALADRLLELGVQPGSEPRDLINLMSLELGRPEFFDRAFVVQLIQRLRDQDPDVWPAFDWLEKQLQTQDTSTHQVIQLEHHQQAASQVTVGNIISSMRLLSALDWRDFFESISLVDPVLAQDATGSYSQMDFQTRDSYRHAVERIASRSSKLPSELEVAQKAVELGKRNHKKDPRDLRRSHVGYFLVGDGILELEKAFDYRPYFREAVIRLIRKYPSAFYLGTLSFLTLGFSALTIAHFVSSPDSAEAGGGWSFFKVVALIVLVVSLASEFGLNLLNHYVTFFMKPQALPKLDLEKGIPEHSRSIVVIPTLFTGEEGVLRLIESLEVHYLANRDPHIHFALLGDFADADLERAPGDEALQAVAELGIRELNHKYAADPGEFRFHSFLRRRQWNPSEGKWIGWERKRGKLQEFNRLIRGATDTSYLLSGPLPAALLQIQYVITLDSDTQLPRNCAHRLIGTITHPLNQPYYDETVKRVTEGYGILQPRVSVDLGSGRRTRFAQIFSGNTGLDPYTTAVSDVYQDLFAEGSFTGKGLYVVDAFERALENRVPENSVLSHDLFEGSYARAALVTDIELFDDYPSDYVAFSKRQHRWVRGDWQIAAWIFGPNSLSLISRWKIFDNLRRSLMAQVMFAWLVLSWSVFPGGALSGTLVVILILSFPIYAPLTTGSVFRPQNLPWREYFRKCALGFQDKIIQIILMVSFLASQAGMQTDAIVRTSYRKLISKKKLLEWVTFAQLESSARGSRTAGTTWIFRNFPDFGTWSAVGIIAGLSAFHPAAFREATPFLALWTLNPLIKTWLKRKVPVKVRGLGTGELHAFRAYARRTWHFFETFVTAEGHWLAPDNFQEDPRPVVAFRTSPTNIGLQLLSTVSAHDFGYLGFLECVESLERTITTLEKMEKMNGHLFNWYDTKSLEPLRPQYISTVDSGNLAGHLLTLKQACIELASGPKFNVQARAGLLDTLALLRGEAEKLESFAESTGSVTHAQLLQAIQDTLDLARGEPQVEGFAGSLSALLEKLEVAADILTALVGTQESPDLPVKRGVSDAPSEVWIWLKAARNQVLQFLRDEAEIVPAEISARLRSLEVRSNELALAMDFTFLFDQARKLFVIGYNVADARRDVSYYDLLASESRLASFIAIAKGDVPEEHWFRLGRKMTPVLGSRALIAWTATMFEYLMPVLVMKRYENTLLEQTYQAIVARQIEYGKNRNVPWGISEAGYNARDLQLNFQYGPFGIPGLGLKRGLSDDLVISPYSTLLAAVIDPWSALTNLKTLVSTGAFARYGFYESIDYTADRLPQNQKFFILKSFMAHHQGMSLVALNHLVNDAPMQRRFHADPLVQATQLLLQEKIPHAVAISRPRAEEVHSESLRFIAAPNPRQYSDIHVSTPRTQLLSNGTYSVMVTSAGSGYSRSSGLSVSRWREDWTRDSWGHFIYIRNRASGDYWSSGYQPVASVPKSYKVNFAEDRVEISRCDGKDGKILTHTEIIVSPEDPVELRRVSITNNSDEACEFELTSFMEVVLAKPNDDAAHPAYSNLFVQTEFVPEGNALLGTRRRRSNHEKQIWAFHGVVSDSEGVSPLQYETDRSKFIGRGRDASNPFVFHEGRPLSNTVGAVLDPIFALRETVRVGPRATVKVTFSTGTAESREEALRLADKYREIHIFAREAEIAWTQSQVQLRHLNVGTDEAHLFQRLAGRILFSDPMLRPRSHHLALNTRKQSNLWAYGISGDLPILLTRISDEKDMAMVRQLLHAHEYLRLKGLSIDLVILNERAPSYIQSLQEELQRQIRMSGSQALLDKPGGVFIRRTDIMPEADVILLKAVARVMLSAEKGTLEEQLKRRPIENELPRRLEKSNDRRKLPPAPVLKMPVLKFFNGLGGFGEGGREYVIILKEGQWTPAPWINVIANSKDFGFLISESGSGYTWSVNSRENRLTPWSNDAVSDPVGEAIYIRDEETGEFWSPTPLPIREVEPYIVTHGQGYTQFQHTSHGIAQQLQLFVVLEAGVKISRLKLKNLGAHPRRLSVSSYVEWVLGFQRGVSAPSVVTEVDTRTQAIFARNAYNNEFADRVAFADMGEANRTFTCDRREFLGRNGSAARPAAMDRVELSGRSGGGMDPCAAFQTHFELAPGEEREISILLGQADSVEEARRLATLYRNPFEVRAAFDRVITHWEEALGALEIRTPDESMNTLVNRWLVYQTLSCRIWARSAFYQSGGAFGFRDQLQDVMALIYSKPEIARAQILTAAARQFKEGDVQHWWHPPTGRGVRTRFSDDLIWLPYVVSFYVKVTGDLTVLSETVSFIESKELEAGEDDSYTLPEQSHETATVFEHCARTLDRSLKTGAHGLPLMGSGDWNDGMNRVGNQGRGESVWVAWFLYKTLSQFLPLFRNFTNGAAGLSTGSPGDLENAARASRYAQHLVTLKTNVEKNAWDGDWYLRAYFDDGSAMGSSKSEECKIDSIAQSWAVLSGAGDPARSVRAMAAVDQHLIRRSDGLINLFSPPFDKSAADPGYIKGYVPGVRENGGQYTHAAIWTMMAYATLGDGDRALELYSLLNPINHSATRAGLHKYKVEPYVMAADIYGHSPHVGRGGWTWYTGSASWMYRSAIESILGFDLRGNRLRIEPCIPQNWEGFEIVYRRPAVAKAGAGAPSVGEARETEYLIQVRNTNATSISDKRITLDGIVYPSGEIPITDDGKKHTVEVIL